MERNVENTTKYLMFKTGGQFYGMPIPPVLQIVVQENITPVKDCPAYIKGTVEFKGAVIPVIDLLFCLCSESTPLSERNCIVVLSIEEERKGYLVENVIEVVDIPEKMEVPASLTEKPEHRFLDGMGSAKGQDIFLMDVPNLLSVLA